MNWYLPNLRRCFKCTCTNQPNRQRHLPTPDEPSPDIPISDIPISDVPISNVPVPDIPANYAEGLPKTCSRCHRTIRTFLQKSDTQSSIIIPDRTISQTSYPLAVLTLDNANSKICQAFFTFSCNIRLEQAVLFLNFRITQQGREYYAPVPLQSNWNYSRQNISSMTDAVTFSTCCCDLIPDENNTICFWADLIGASQGAAYITNSILTALIQIQT